MLDRSDEDRPETWRFQIAHTWWGPPSVEELQTPEARKQFVRERFALLCEPWKTASVVLGEQEDLHFNAFRQWSPVVWDNYNGMITLAGDAAHSMLPRKLENDTCVYRFPAHASADRSQGLNNAFQDAAAIFDAVKATVAGNSTLKSGITAYEEEMRPRGAKEVALSLETAKQTSDVLNSPMFTLGLRKDDEKGPGWETTKAN